MKANAASCFAACLAGVGLLLLTSACTRSESTQSPPSPNQPSLAAKAAIPIKFDYKGVVLGEQNTPAGIKALLGIDCGAGADGMSVCNGSVTVVRNPAQMNLVMNRAGRVQRIWLTDISSDVYQDVASALTSKFGRPPDETKDSTVQTRVGATFPQQVLRWSDPNGNSVELKRLSGSIDKSELYFSTKEDRQLFERLSRERKADI